jgi:uncharacterized protein (TIGR03382 family)
VLGRRLFGRPSCFWPFLAALALPATAQANAVWHGDFECGDISLPVGFLVLAAALLRRRFSRA